jgi:DinB superfamily
MRQLFCTVLAFTLMLPSLAQQSKLWSEENRKYLIDNLSRTRDSIITETKNLSQAQWNFKESPDRWSINQIVEHLGIWELLLQREISQALVAGPRPELNKDARTDSAVVGFLMEENPHIATEYTKPFTFTVPMGLNDGKNNLALFLKMRNEGVNYVDSTSADLRAYFLRPGRGNIHQVFITIFAHTDRHLRQIRKVKLDPKYPKR